MDETRTAFSGPVQTQQDEPRVRVSSRPWPRPCILSVADNDSFAGRRATSWPAVPSGSSRAKQLTVRSTTSSSTRPDRWHSAMRWRCRLCARNVVLLGDPSQLAQVGQGRQPLHAGDSVLQHLLGDRHTVAPRARHLPRRVVPHAAGDLQLRLRRDVRRPATARRRHGLHRVDVTGDTNAPVFTSRLSTTAATAPAPSEEAEYIVSQIVALRASGRVTDSWPPDWKGSTAPLEDRDVIVVTPYNAQRRLDSAQSWWKPDSPASESAPSTSFKDKRPPSFSIRWRPRAAKTCRAIWAFSSTATDSTSPSLERAPLAYSSAVRGSSTFAAIPPSRWLW